MPGDAAAVRAAIAPKRCITSQATPAAAMRAAADSKRGITSQVMLQPCAQPLIVKRGITCQAMLHACST